MTKYLLTLLLLVFGLSAAYAHGGDKEKREKMFREIQEFKMKFLAQEMELDDDQKERFVKLYDELEKKRFSCMNAARKLERKVRKDPDATEQEYKTAADAMNKARSECVNIEKAYDAKFAEFLTQKQIFKMKSAEEEFRKKMEEMRHKKKRK